MKYAILIHSNPQPWGHPTSDYVAEHKALPQEQRDKLNADFDALLAQLGKNGELVGGGALGDPAGSKLYHWHEGSPTSISGPYAEGQEHLAGYFVINVESSARAEEIAAGFSGPGETVELRPLM